MSATIVNAENRVTDAQSLAFAATLKTTDEVQRALDDRKITAAHAVMALMRLTPQPKAARTFPDIRRTFKNRDRVWIALGKAAAGEMWSFTLSRNAARVLVEKAKAGALDVILTDYDSIPVSSDPATREKS